MFSNHAPVLSLDELRSFLDDLHADGKVIVFTNGCFDILHRGHVQYLEKARSLGDILVVGLNSDSSVRRIKGPSRPVFSETDRAFVLAGLRAISYVVIFDEDTPLDLILSLRPDVLVKGGDWREEDIVGGKEIKQWGGKVETVEYLEGYSSSEIIDKLNDL